MSQSECASTEVLSPEIQGEQGNPESSENVAEGTTSSENSAENTQSNHPSEDFNSDSNGIASESTAEITTEKAPECNGVDPEHTAPQDAKLEEQQTNAPGKSLDTIQNMLAELNSEIYAMKSKVSTENAMLKQAQTESAAKNGQPAEGQTTPNPKLDLDAVRKRNEELRKEIMAIKTAQASRELPPNAQEQQILGAVMMNKLKDTTSSLNTEIELITRAGQAQLNMKQRALERQKAAEEAVRKAREAASSDVSVDEIKSSISMLKEHMDSIIQQPVAPILPDSSDEPNEATSTTSNGDSEAASSNEEGQGGEGGAGDSESSKAKKINAKAQDDLLKKYLLLKVMGENVAALTNKMNSIMKSKGIEPAQTGQTEKSTSSETESKTANVSDSVGSVPENSIEENVEDTAPENYIEENVEDNVEENDDDYFMYEDEGAVDEELYVEEDNKDEITVQGEKSQMTDVPKENEVNKSPQKETVIDSQEKDSSLKDVLQDTEKNSDVTAAPSDLDAAENNVSDINICKNDEKNATKGNDEDLDETVMKAKKLLESQCTLKSEVKMNTSEVEEGKVGDHESKNETGEDMGYDTSKMKTYYLLLKLQKEMAGMQIQLSKLQDNMRATNTALQTILEHEFSDMNQ